jgi:hypothetical protein
LPCLKDCGNDDVRVVSEHRGEAQDQPAIRNERVLPPSIRFKEILILFVQPAVNLDGEFEVWEGDVDVVDAALEDHREVCPPTGESRTAQNPVCETLRGRPGFVPGVDEQLESLLVADAVRSQAKA